MSINKSRGVTRTEEFLSLLCDRSFLKLWSYPNLFKDDQKELCDLLVFFESNILVFFDRERFLPCEDDEDQAIEWARWKRKVIDSQISTANGAERYIKENRKIFLDAGLTKPFPIPIDSSSAKIYKRFSLVLCG